MKSQFRKKKHIYFGSIQKVNICHVQVSRLLPQDIFTKTKLKLAALPNHKHISVMQRGLLEPHANKFPLHFKSCHLELEHEAPELGGGGEKRWTFTKCGEKGNIGT